MEVRYKREVNHNYMILDAPSEGGGYECRMLASNTIEGLLRFRVRINGNSIMKLHPDSR